MNGKRNGLVVIERNDDESKVKIDIGAGARTNEGYIRLDVVPYFRPELMAALTTLPFARDSVDQIICHHVLEHLERKDLIPAMNEMHRVLKPGGIAEIEVPLFPFWQAIADPTHVSFFVSQTFDYFCTNPDLEYKRDQKNYDFIVKERREHMMLYGIRPWELVRRMRFGTGEIERIEMEKVDA